VWNDLFAALALVLVFEGMLPFLKPGLWRQTMGRIAEQNDQALRVLGLFCMLMGVFLLYMIRRV